MKTVMVKGVTDQTLLQYFEDKGMKLPVQCRGGYCGTCRCKVKDVTAFEEVADQLGFKDDDEILPCVVRMKSENSESEVYLPTP